MENSRMCRESAVSPVIGVMLMLVVTIIIAALVSAFSGNMISSDASAPQATITGTYSQSKGLTMIHEGGDNLMTADLEILVRLSDEFGYGQSEYGTRKLNFSTITNGKTVNGEKIYWVEMFGTYGVVSWLPGESMYILNDEDANGDLANSGLIQRNEHVIPYYSAYDQASGSSRYYINGLNNQFNIGKTITLEVYQKGGEMISTSDMTIQP